MRVCFLPPDSRYRRVHPVTGRHRNGIVASLGDSVEVQEGEGRRGRGGWREHAIGVKVSVHGPLGEAHLEAVASAGASE